MADQQRSSTNSGMAFPHLPASLAVHAVLLLSLGMVAIPEWQPAPPLDVSLAFPELMVPELRLHASPPLVQAPLEILDSAVTASSPILDSPDRELDALNRDLEAQRLAAMNTLRPPVAITVPVQGQEPVMPTTRAWLPASRNAVPVAVVAVTAPRIIEICESDDGQEPGSASVETKPVASEPTTTIPPSQTVAARLVAWTLPPALRGRFTGTVECRISVDSKGKAGSVEFTKGTGDEVYDRLLRGALMLGQYAPATRDTKPVDSILIQEIAVK